MEAKQSNKRPGWMPNLFDVVVIAVVVVVVKKKKG